jgi:GTP:adenosylcobinamide-phosphate guanylyltransferase
MSAVSVLILAGSRGGDDPMTRAENVAHKALIEIDGEPMIARVLRALWDCPSIGHIAISASNPDCLSPVCGQTEILPAASGPSTSVMRAAKYLGTPLLVTTADHALLQAEWISYFLSHLPDADIVAAVAREEIINAALPETQRTYLRFRDQAISGCNLFYLANDKALNAVQFWQSLEADRKAPIKLLRKLGPVFALRYALGRLTLSDALEALGQRAGAKPGLVDMPFGLAAVDVDKPSDLALVRAHIGTE